MRRIGFLTVLTLGIPSILAATKVKKKRIGDPNPRYIHVDTHLEAMHVNLVDNKTGKILPCVQWANTRTGDYGQIELPMKLDSNGDIIVTKKNGDVRFVTAKR